MHNRNIFFLISILLISLFGLVRIKIYGQDLQNNIQKMEAQKATLKSELGAIKAEWAYLNNNERLTNLNVQYLKLKQVSSVKVKLIEGKKTVHAVSQVAPQQEWRFKSRTNIMKVKHQ